MDRYIVNITKEHIVIAFNKVKAEIAHTDAPTESDLIKVRDELWHGMTAEHGDMLCLNWLRNMIVKIRKDGKLSSTKKRKP